MTPGSTKVDVYNASNRNGLAGSVSKSLAERGFVIGKVANDPSKRKAPAVAEIRHGKAGARQAQAKLLRTSLPKGTTIVVDTRKGTGVDVALGAKFTNLPRLSTAPALPMCPAPSGS